MTRKMSVYRRFIRARKGMSTIFAGLFFIILILIGFSLMTWQFVQYDSYTNVILSMNQRDQQAISESLAPTAPGATGFSGTTFNIVVNNTGRVLVMITRIYISNILPTVSTQCSGSSICIIDAASPTNCAGHGNCAFTNSYIKVGENNHVIQVTGLTIGDGSGYKVVMATTRGRQFSFYYPWPVSTITSPGGGGSNSNSTNTVHGPLEIQLQVNSFNFTTGTQTVSNPAWKIPYNTPIVFWVKIINNANYSITLSQYSNLYLICEPPGRDCEDVQAYFVSDNQTLNPSNIIAYNPATRSVTFPPAGPSGPNGFTIVKFGSFTPESTTSQHVNEATPYLFFLVLFYQIGNPPQVVGQMLDYFAVRACNPYPACP